MHVLLWKKNNKKNIEVEKQTIFLEVCTESVYSWTTDDREGRRRVQGDRMTLVMSAASSSCWQQIVCHRLSSGDKPERAQNQPGHSQFSSRHLHLSARFPGVLLQSRPTHAAAAHKKEQPWLCNTYTQHKFQLPLFEKPQLLLESGQTSGSTSSQRAQVVKVLGFAAASLDFPLALQLFNLLTLNFNPS